MKDTIYREDAIKALRCEYPTMPMFKNLREEWAIKTEGYRKAEEIIMSLPSADRWIPCSERLPKENTEVLISLEWGIDIGEYRNGDWHSEWINHYDDDDVLAWMPLPESYKGADDENNH